MPQAIAAAAAAINAIAAYIGATIGTAALYATGDIAIALAVTGVATTIAEAGIYVGLSAGAAALTAPSIPNATASKTPFHQTRPARKRGWGIARIGGSYMLYEGNGTNAWLVTANHDGLIASWIRFYLHDDWVTVDGSGWVNGRYEIDNSLTSSTYGTRIFINDGKRYTPNHVMILSRIGLATETAYSQIVAAVPQFWTTAHRGDGIASIGVLCNQGAAKYFNEDYPNGLPQISGVGMLKPVWDPRSSSQSRTDPTTWTWSANWLLCILDYLLHDPHGPLVDYDRRIAPVIDDLKSEADYCDNAVSLKAGGTEPRYQVNGAYDLDNHPADVLKRLLESADGFMAQRGDGAIILKAGRYDAPDDTMVLTDEYIISITYSHWLPDEQAVNELVVSFTSPDHDYTEVQTDSWDNQDDIDARGVVRPQNLPLGWVQSNGQARRLAKRKMSQLGAPFRGVLKTNLYGLDMLEQRYFRLQIPAISTLADVVVEIDPSGKPELDLNTLTVSIPFIAADPNVDSWNPTTEEGNGVPLVPRSSVESLSPPTITSVTPVYDSAGDGAGVRLQVTIANPGRADAAFGLRWKVLDAVSWVETSYAGPFASSGDIVLETGFVTANATIEVSAELLSGSGSYSDWSDPPVELSTATDTTVPDALTGLAVSSWDATLLLICNPVPRARTYAWSFYKADGTTLIKTYTTSAPTFPYTAAQAASDGVQRSYVIKAAGLNGAGAGTLQSITATKAAPAAVTGATGTGGTTTGQVAFTSITGVAGYLVAYSDTTGFNPVTYGASVKTGASPAYLSGLAAGTFYSKVAAYDAWSSDPSLLNFSAQTSFVITSGGGSTPPGGGAGGGAGGGGARADRFSTE